MTAYLPVAAVVVCGLAVLILPFVAGRRASRARTPDLSVPEPAYQTDFEPFVPAIAPEDTPTPAVTALTRRTGAFAHLPTAPVSAPPASPTKSPANPAPIPAEATTRVAALSHVATPVVTADETDAFFRDDPLGALSLPSQLESSVVAEAVVLDLLKAGVLPPDRVFPVNARWVPWGYDLTETTTTPAEKVGDRQLLDLTIEMELPELTQGVMENAGR
jgi:hypothetical protein